MLQLCMDHLRMTLDICSYQVLSSAQCHCGSSLREESGEVEKEMKEERVLELN